MFVLKKLQHQLYATTFTFYSSTQKLDKNGLHSNTRIPYQCKFRLQQERDGSWVRGCCFWGGSVRKKLRWIKYKNCCSSTSKFCDFKQNITLPVEISAQPLLDPEQLLPNLLREV